MNICQGSDSLDPANGLTTLVRCFASVYWLLCIVQTKYNYILRRYYMAGSLPALRCRWVRVTVACLLRRRAQGFPTTLQFVLRLLVMCERWSTRVNARMLIGPCVLQKVCWQSSAVHDVLVPSLAPTLDDTQSNPQLVVSGGFFTDVV